VSKCLHIAFINYKYGDLQHYLLIFIINFYKDLKNLARGWFQIDGIWLGARNQIVSLTIMNKLDKDECDLTFITDQRVRN